MANEVRNFVLDCPIAATCVWHRATDVVIRHFEVHLRLEVSQTKSVATGSDVGAMRALVQRVAPRKLAPKLAAKLLGTPNGRKRSVHACRVRLAPHQVKRRRGKLAAVRRAGGCTAS